MAGDTPEAAVDAFVERIRKTLDCFLSGTAFGSGHTLGVEHSLTLYTEGQTSPNVARLSSHEGEGELLLRFAHLYTVVFVPDDDQRGPDKVSSSFYQYRILDRDENEIVVYHWEPEGTSAFRTPHMHVPASPPTVLPQRAGSRLATEKTHVGKLHFPTGRIFAEEIAELLIGEFKVDPQRDDWREVLRDNREAIGRGRTW